MRKKQKGFTLVELLAVMVILGIIMVIALPNVTGILSKNRNSTYIEDAKKLATTAEYKLRGSSTGIIKPTNGQCVIMNLAYLDNSEFEEPPYGGEYLKNKSYVVIKKNGAEFEYYVQLLEQIEAGKNLRGISLMKSTDLYKDGATELTVDNVAPSSVFNMSDYAFVYGADTENAEKASDVLDLIDSTVVDCSGGIVYIYATE